jgi:hypothetical protein
MDLKIESAKLPEGEAADLSGTPASAAEPGGPLAEEDKIDQEEFDASRLSINDEYAPIKAQQFVDRMFPRQTLTEKTAMGPDYAKRELRNKKRRRIDTGMSDHGRMTSHDPKNQSDSISHPYGEKKDLINPLKDAHKDLMKFESQEDHYGDTNTSEIDSIVKGLKARFTKSPSRESEEEGT